MDFPSNHLGGVSLSGQKPRLLDQVRERLRVKNYAYRTETSYVDWIRRFILFHNKRHPADRGASYKNGLPEMSL